MKDKLAPDTVEDVTLLDNQNEKSTQDKVVRGIFENPTSASDLEFNVLIDNYVEQIIEKVADETVRIVCIPGVLEIGIETGFNFKDSCELYKKILERTEDIIFGTSFALNDEGVIFKNLPASEVYN